MGRGINLGNVLSAPTEGNWAFSVYEEYFDQVKDEGFSNVRIPVDFFGGTFLNADYTVNGSERTLGNLSNCDDNSCFSELAGTQNQYNGSVDDYYMMEEVLSRRLSKINQNDNCFFIRKFKYRKKNFNYS